MCKDADDEDCWWRLVSPENGERAVNASCIDERVQSSLKSKNPACWKACEQPDNATAKCPVSCLFETMIGDPTSGRKALTKQEVSHLLIYQSPACFTNPLTIMDMLLRSCHRLRRRSMSRRQAAALTRDAKLCRVASPVGLAKLCIVASPVGLASWVCWLGLPMMLMARQAC